MKCPLHGERFKPIRFHIYVGKWRRESEPRRRQLLSPQYRKAWDAGFPPELWPATEEKSEDGTIFLKLKDGTKLEGLQARIPTDSIAEVERITPGRRGRNQPHIQLRVEAFEKPETPLHGRHRWAVGD